MNSQKVQESEIDIIVPFAKQSCREFMRGELPRNFKYQKMFHMKHGVVVGMQTYQTIAHWETDYGGHVFTIVLTKHAEGVVGWWASISDKSDPDKILFSTSDIIKESV